MENNLKKNLDCAWCAAGVKHTDQEHISALRQKGLLLSDESVKSTMVKYNKLCPQKVVAKRDFFAQIDNEDDVVIKAGEILHIQSFFPDFYVFFRGGWHVDTMASIEDIDTKTEVLNA